MGLGALIPFIRMGWALGGELNLVFTEPGGRPQGTSEGV